MNEKTTYATEVDGKIAIIIGTVCSSGYCHEYGCDFPDCAKLGEKFETKEDALLKYPNIEMV